MYKSNSNVVNFVLCTDNSTWLFNLICDSVLVILFWVKQCLYFCHSIQDNLCKDNSTWIIFHSLCLFCLLKVVVLVLAAMVYGLCMSGYTCTCMLAGFLQLKPLMKTSFTIAAPFSLLLDYLWNNMCWFYWFYVLFECKFNGMW